MLDPDTMAIITGAAGTLSADAVRAGIPKLRDGLKRVRVTLARAIRLAGPDEQGNALAAYDATAAAILERRPTEIETQLTQARSELATQLERILTAYLAAYPEAKSELAILASSAGTARRTYIQSSHDQSTFVGGDLQGDLTINHGERRD
ncbi:hypothetical protein [Streptomyces collinus]|uniref:hypothetical protein n=1 Tax=Streptomyces collinus TaxID=42684 RepID=UPI003639DBB6